VKIERIEMIYSQGTAEKREDGFIVNPPFFGVVDGFSAPYHYKMEQNFFDEMSGGEMVRQVVLETFYGAKPNSSLEDLILQVNRRIGEIQTAQRIPIDRSDLLAGASFAFVKVKVEAETIEVIQGGNCFAVWQHVSGKIGTTKNQAFYHEADANLEISLLLEKHKGNRKEMWVDFYPILCKMRRRDYNNPNSETGFAVLNGQSQLAQCWQKVEIPLREIEILLLYTDGFTRLALNGEKRELKLLVSIYQKERLNQILKETRQIETKLKKSSYIDYQEATAVAVKFGG